MDVLLLWQTVPVFLFNALFQQAKAGFPGEVEGVRRLTRGVFRAGKRVFILNSKPNVIENIRVCLRYYFRNMTAT